MAATAADGRSFLSQHRAKETERLQRGLFGLFAVQDNSLIVDGPL